MVFICTYGFQEQAIRLLEVCHLWSWLETEASSVSLWEDVSTATKVCSGVEVMAKPGMQNHKWKHVSTQRETFPPDTTTKEHSLIIFAKQGVLLWPNAQKVS